MKILENKVPINIALISNKFWPYVDKNMNDELSMHEFLHFVAGVSGLIEEKALESNF